MPETQTEPYFCHLMEADSIVRWDLIQHRREKRLGVASPVQPMDVSFQTRVMIPTHGSHWSGVSSSRLGKILYFRATLGLAVAFTRS